MSDDPQAMTLTEFLLARLVEDEAGAVREREFHEDWPDTPACDSCNPARMVAECEAKQRIVERAVAAAPVLDDDARWAFVETLRNLATIYADHEDFDESWRP